MPEITNNMPFTTYWKVRPEFDTPIEEPQMKIAQYEIERIVTDYGVKIQVRVFVAVSDLEKRKFYTEFIFPIGSQFAKDLAEFLPNEPEND